MPHLPNYLEQLKLLFITSPVDNCQIPIAYHGYSRNTIEARLRVRVNRIAFRQLPWQSKNSLYYVSQLFSSSRRSSLLLLPRTWLKCISSFADQKTNLFLLASPIYLRLYLLITHFRSMTIVRIIYSNFFRRSKPFSDDSVNIVCFDFDPAAEITTSSTDRITLGQLIYPNCKTLIKSYPQYLNFFPVSGLPIPPIDRKSILPFIVRAIAIELRYLFCSFLPVETPLPYLVDEILEVLYLRAAAKTTRFEVVRSVSSHFGGPPLCGYPDASGCTQAPHSVLFYSTNDRSNFSKYSHEASPTYWNFPYLKIFTMSHSHAQYIRSFSSDRSLFEAILVPRFSLESADSSIAKKQASMQAGSINILLFLIEPLPLEHSVRLGIPTPPFYTEKIYDATLADISQVFRGKASVKIYIKPKRRRELIRNLESVFPEVVILEPNSSIYSIAADLRPSLIISMPFTTAAYGHGFPSVFYYPFSREFLDISAAYEGVPVLCGASELQRAANELFKS